MRSLKKEGVGQGLANHFMISVVLTSIAIASSKESAPGGEGGCNGDSGEWSGESEGAVTEQTESIAITVQGQSGKFTIYDAEANSASCDANAIKVTMDALYERDAAGNSVGKAGNAKHSINTFAPQNFTFAAAENNVTIGTDNVTIGTAAATRLSFSTPFKGLGDSVLTVDTFAMTRAGSVGTDNETWAVTSGDIMFNLVLSDWQWCGVDAGDVSCSKGQSQEIGAFVDFVISVKGGGAAVPAEGGKSVSLGGGATIEISDRVKIDGIWMAMPEGYPLVEAKGSSTTFTFRFPRFESTAMYTTKAVASTSWTSTTSKCCHKALPTPSSTTVTAPSTTITAITVATTATTSIVTATATVPATTTTIPSTTTLMKLTSTGTDDGGGDYDDDDFTGGLCFNSGDGKQVCEDSDGEFPAMKWGAPLLGPIDEDTALGTIVTTLPMPSIDGAPMSFGDVTFSLIDGSNTSERRRHRREESSPPSMPFSVDATTGAVTVDAALDYETRPSYSFTVGVAGNRRSNVAVDVDGGALDPLPFTAAVEITIDLAPVACPAGAGFSATGTFPCMVYTACGGGADIEIFPPTNTTDRVCTVSKSNVPGVAEAAEAAASASAAAQAAADNGSNSTATTASGGMVAGIIIGVALVLVLVALLTKRDQGQDKDAVDESDPSFASAAPVAAKPGTFDFTNLGGEDYRIAAGNAVGRGYMDAEYMDADGIAAKQAANIEATYEAAASGDYGNPTYAFGTNPNPLGYTDPTYNTAAPTNVHGEVMYSGDALYSVAASGGEAEPTYDFGTMATEPMYDMGNAKTSMGNGGGDGGSGGEALYAMADGMSMPANPLLVRANAAAVNKNQPVYALGDSGVNATTLSSGGSISNAANAAEPLYAFGAASETLEKAMYGIARVNSVKEILLGGGSRRGSIRSAGSQQQNRRSSVQSFWREDAAVETAGATGRSLSRTGRSSSYGDALNTAGISSGGSNSSTANPRPTYEIAASKVRLSTSVGMLASVVYDVGDLDEDMMNSATMQRVMDGSNTTRGGCTAAAAAAAPERRRTFIELDDAAPMQASESTDDAVRPEESNSTGADTNSRANTSGSNAPAPHVYDLSMAAMDVADNNPEAVWEAIEVNPETGPSFRIKSIRRSNPLMQREASGSSM